MRVLYYSRALQSATGGGTHARGLVRALRELGHEVLALPDEAPAEAGHDARRSAAPEWVKIVGRERRARARRRAARTLVDRALAFDPDVTIVRRTTYDLVADELAERCASPVVAEVNALVATEAHTWGERIPSWEARRERDFLLGVDRVSCVSAEVAQEAIAAGASRDKVLVIENGVDPALFSAEAKPLPEVAAWAASHDGIVGYCGTVGALRDVATLVDAADAILDVRPATGFLWVGLPEAVIAETAPRRVAAASRAVGPQEHETVPAWLVVSDVCWGAFAYRHMSPLKVYEYAALEKPVVVSADGMPARVVEESGAGVAVRPADAEALAREVVRFLANADLAEKTGRAGRSWVLGGHTWQHVAARMIEGLAR